MAAIGLSGCYESKTDLIGSNAFLVQKADGVFLKGDQGFYVDKVGKDLSLCSLQGKPGSQGACGNRYPAKIERLSLGNYLVQVQTAPQRFLFGIWNRRNSETDRTSCFLLLGEDIVGPSLLSTILPGIDRDQSSPAAVALRDFPEQAIENRETLLRIAGIYEFQLMRPNTALCAKNRVTMTDSGFTLIIERDNRHIPPLN